MPVDTPVVGSYRSAALVAAELASWPPATRTWPFGSNVAVGKSRAAFNPPVPQNPPTVNGLETPNTLLTVAFNVYPVCPRSTFRSVKKASPVAFVCCVRVPLNTAVEQGGVPLNDKVTFAPEMGLLLPSATC